MLVLHFIKLSLSSLPLLVQFTEMFFTLKEIQLLDLSGFFGPIIESERRQRNKVEKETKIKNF